MEMISSMNGMKISKRVYAHYAATSFFSIFVGLMVVLNTYTVPGLSFFSLDELLFVVAFPFLAVACHRKNLISRKDLFLVLFIIYTLLLSLFSVVFIENNALNVIVRVAREAFYYAIIFWLGNNLFSIGIFKNIFSKIVLLLAAFVLIQAVVYYITGFFIPGLLLNARINDNGVTGGEMYYSLLSYASYSGYIKPNGFLTEPSTCAHWFFVYLLIVLFDTKERHNFWKAVFVSVAMIATMSTSAFLELFLAWLLWLFWFKKKTFIIVMVVALVTFPTIFLTLRNSDSIFGSVINRFFDAFSKEKSEFSSGLRIVRGFKIYGSLPISYKIFGIGFGSYEAAVKSGIVNPLLFSDMENEYMNSFSYLLVSSGIIGLSLFVFYFMSLFKTRDRIGKALIISLTFLFFGTSVYCSSLFVIMMLLILSFKKNNYGRSFNTQF